MDKKCAVVVGGSGGIGSETVRMLSAKGFIVCFTYHQNERRAEELQRMSPDVAGYKMDLTVAHSVKSTFVQILKDHPIIDVVVFSVTPPITNRNILKTEWRDHEEHLQLQSRGLFWVMQGLNERITLKIKLKFIVIGTEYCIGKPPAGLSHYVQAKYSLLGLAKSMAVDLAKYNCTVNVISPGMVATPLIDQLPPKLVEITAEGNPLKRIALPADVAQVVVFLAGDVSDYLNGANLTVNGGSTML